MPVRSLNDLLSTGVYGSSIPNRLLMSEYVFVYELCKLNLNLLSTQLYNRTANGQTTTGDPNCVAAAVKVSCVSTVGGKRVRTNARERE